ncbi:plexin-D1 isoform X1 [Bufo gargarizans]|uniref:plexin-D1 isoform X1 n=1 Tax=Bufo gargarizans TaxID=30331 RepID=UPI001CF47AB1|nr:plexin-D1 isoform X1 [Bufo gargarizans]
MASALLLLLLLLAPALGLELVNRFFSSQPTNNFALDGAGHRVYLAAVNHLYQLRGDLRLELEEQTGPVQDSPLCHAPQIPESYCEFPKTWTPNYNKILELDPDQGLLLVCGSIHQGLCDLRALGNLTRRAVPFPPRNVVPSMLNVAANHANASTVGLLLKSQEGDTRLLVGATYTGFGSQFFSWNNSVADLRFENSPEISIRALNTSHPSRLFTFDISPSDDNIFKVKQGHKVQNRMVFMRAFQQGGFGYLAMNVDPASTEKESLPSSVLARICLKPDPRGEPRKLTESYIQLRLRCEGPRGTLYGRLLSVYAEPGRIFGVFEGRREAALCAFGLEEVGRKIRGARSGCFESRDNGEVSVLASVVQGSGPSCEWRNNIKVKLQEEQLDCGAAHLQHPLAINRPLSATAIFKAPGLTSVAVANVGGYNVAFLGTAGGQLQKINIDADMNIISRQSIQIARGQPVHHIMQFDPVDPTYLYVMTSHQMTRVKVADCEKFLTCSECLQAADPYCGWCAMEARCSIQQECRHSEDSKFWTGPSRDGVDLCPALQIIPKEIDVYSDTKTILLQITGNLPSLALMNTSCDYGNGAFMPAIIVYDADTSQQWAHCAFLPKDQIPAFPENRDHVTIPMAVTVDGINIALQSFVIYDCERTQRIHLKTSCTSCVTSPWPCTWCEKQHKCMYNALQCDIAVKNSTDCPQITTRHIAPTPTGLAKDFILSVANVNTPQDLALECDFGGEQTFPARWLNSTSVLCSNVLLHTSESSRKFPVNLQLMDHSGQFLDNPDTLTVEVYNCASEATDCSRCLGRTDLGHLCTWSESSASCRLNSELLPIQNTCPTPEIRKIEPVSGPLLGGTLLTIQGRNLGSRFSDIVDKVKIGDVPCYPVLERYLVSEEIVCVTGESPTELSEWVSVDINGRGRSKEKYSFMLPEVFSLSPDFGPRAGGTKITLSGNQLDIGGEVRVLFNETLDCNDLVRTESSIRCTVPAMGSIPSTSVSVCVQFERKSCLNGNLTFQYKEDPVIRSMEPRSSHMSGGRIITLTGERFDMVQDVKMKIINHKGELMNCTVLSDVVIICPSPTAPNSTLERKNVSVGFYINGVYVSDERTDLSDDPAAEEHLEERFSLEYQPDPMFFTAKKEKLIKHHVGEPLTLVIHKEHDDLGLRVEEYQVKVGQIPCELIVFNDKVIHCSINESLSSSDHYLPVTIQVGKLNQTITMLHLAGIEMPIIISIVVFIVLLLLCVVALFVFCTKSRRAERYWQKTLVQMEEMESQIREEIRKGFAELQTDMTDLTKELNRSQGIPFLEYKHFVTRTFFPKCSSIYEECYILPPKNFNNQLGIQVPETHPLLCSEWKVPENCRTNMEEGIATLSTLLSNRHFLITFIHAVEAQKDFAVRDRCNLASLLTIALHGKLEYYTSIMKDLLVDLIDSSASKNPKLMLRRTESVVEKMLTNWMSICMYSCLRETVGEPFFLLLCAIKQQINKGSIDAITGKARYTLNEEWLLRENIEAKPMNINVSFQGCGMDSLPVRVLDTDTVSQCKEKILEAFCKNLPYSQWPQVEDVDLEWFAFSSRGYILRDLDDSSIMEDGRKKLNTLSHYKVCDGASLAMSLKDQRDDNTLGRVKDLDTDKYFHLVLPTDDILENRKSHRQSHRKKVLPEIYLTRLLSTKGTLQKFLDDLFRAILSIHDDRPPLAIKYFFDFLEEQAEKRGISDPDTLHIWKTNSLPLRFWVNILKNPEFVFDMEKSDHMDACLSVIAQAFIDACSISDMQLGKDSPTNKLLYAKEIPEYRKIVQKYYRQIKEMSPLSEQEMNAHLAEESRKYQNKFNTNVALAEIYKYAKKYRSQIVNALETNPITRRGQLQHKFEQLIVLMEDDIYTCSSDA